MMSSRSDPSPRRGRSTLPIGDTSPMRAPSLDRDELIKLLYSCSEMGNVDRWNRWRSQTGQEDVCLEDVDLSEKNLDGANFTRVDFRNANLADARLEGASFFQADLCGTNLAGAYIQGADFTAAIVDGRTLIWNCRSWREADFTGVGLGNARIDPDLRSGLEGNVRRIFWREWYKRHRILRLSVQPFWWLSDYGTSTVCILLSFFLFAVVFGFLYLLPYFADRRAWGVTRWAFLTYSLAIGVLGALLAWKHTEGWRKPQRTAVALFLIACGFAFTHTLAYVWVLSSPSAASESLICNLRAMNGTLVRQGIVPLRAFYFSVVTMTTLGFGDIHACPTSIAGHVLLIVQVFFGYVLLGALVTRLAVMFELK